MLETRRQESRQGAAKVMEFSGLACLRPRIFREKAVERGANWSALRARATAYVIISRHIK
jgi:hypothetical protein